jgi:3-deoxy-7-phosphoheptulonate synthase
MHPTPCEAWCDADQAIDPGELKTLMSELTQIASILNRKI